MGPSGHKKVEWDPETGEGVDVARTTFDQLKSQRMMMFERDPDPEGGAAFSKMKEFRPEVREILAVPPLAGG
jgi:hypothetical protein